jgi:2-keto-4-pentenoate hydratase/2-oxohepta-3-ene-1,7-dioic acid hydratase in catechol pathway
MGISVIRFKRTPSSDPHWGLLEKSVIHELPWQEQELSEVITRLSPPFTYIRQLAVNTGLDIDKVIILSPLTSGSQLLCQGLNYSDHVTEAGVKDRSSAGSENSLFLKSSASLTGAFSQVIRPNECQLLDYEIELGLVIKKNIDQAITVSQEQLSEYVAGFIICNDVSARDVQLGAPAMQWFQGKSYRSFCPAGPILYILDKNEIQQLPKLELNLWVNGQLRQQASTSQLIHKPHKTLQQVSRFSNLKPGDCLLTGTPGGVALEMNLKTGLSILLNMSKDAKRKAKFTQAQSRIGEYLKDGDVIEAQITSRDGSIHLGRQKNTVVAEPA